MTDTHHQAHDTRMASLLSSGRYSDLTVACRGREFHVHRVILCSASKFFAAAFDGGFKVRLLPRHPKGFLYILVLMTSQEGHDARIDLTDDDPEALQRMFSYLYTTRYDDEDLVDEQGAEDPSQATTTPADVSAFDQIVVTPNPEEKSHEATSEPAKVNAQAVLNNALVYALAEKYDIQSLKDLAKDKFEARSALPWDDDNLCTMLEVVYSTTPSTDRGLRDVAACICLRHIDASAGRVLHAAPFQEVVSKDGALAFNILLRTHAKMRVAEDQGEIDGAKIGRQAEALETAGRKTQFLEEQLQSAKASGEKEGNALQDQLATLKQHAQEEQKAFIELIQKGTKCRHCKTALRVRVAEPYTSSDDRHVYLKCQSCDGILETVRCG